MLSEVVEESAITPRRSISVGDRVLELGVELRRLAVADELDRLEATDRSHVADPLEALAQLAQPLASPAPRARRTFSSTGSAA